MKIACLSYSWFIQTFTSPKIEKCNSPGVNRHTVNTLATIAFCEIGRGHEAMKTFTSCMTMPLSMVKKHLLSFLMNYSKPVKMLQMRL